MKTPKEPPRPAVPEAGYQFGRFRLDPKKRRLWRDDELVPVTPKALDTLLVLVKHAGQVVEKDDLIREVWPDTFVVEDNLTQSISSLRKALGDSSEVPEYIATIPRRGYRFVASVKTIHSGEETDRTMSGATSANAVDHDILEAPIPRGASRERLWMFTSVLLFGLVIALSAVVWSVRQTDVPSHAVRFAVHPPDGLSLGSGGVISPDGRSLVFTAEDGSGKTVLMVRTLDSLNMQALAGTDGATNPFWSPDSASVGFFAEGKLKRVGLSGEAPKSLVDVGDRNGGGTWSREGTILFAPVPSDGLYRVDAAGGVAARVTTVDLPAGQTRHEAPSFLPDGRHFLYVSVGTPLTGIYLGSLDSDSTERLVDMSREVIFSTAYAPSGHLLFVRDRALIIQAFDMTSRKLSGEPRRLLEHVSSFSVSENGTLALNPNRGTFLAWFERAGRQLEVVPHSDGLGNPEVSPDERTVAVNRRGTGTPPQEILLIDTRRAATRFTAISRPEAQPLWSPDGRHLVFASGGDLYRARVDLPTQTERLLETPTPEFPSHWSLDGRYIAYDALSARTKFDLWVLPTFGDRTPVAYLRTTFNEQHGKIAPDGRWMAYESDESGTREIYVQSFPELGEKRRVSVSGGTQPRWRRDGRELFYLAGDRKLMAVDIRTTPNLDVGAPKALFQTDAPTFGRNNYDVSTDGQRFLVETRVDPRAPITVVLNWPALIVE